jgi:hypothetical protein
MYFCYYVYLWKNIEDSINIKLGRELSIKYTKQKRKITILDNKYHDTTKQNSAQFPFNHGVKNLTQI